jgi:hypothetical protein
MDAVINGFPEHFKNCVNNCQTKSDIKECVHSKCINNFSSQTYQPRSTLETDLSHEDFEDIRTLFIHSMETISN